MFLVANKADLEDDRKVCNEVFVVNYIIFFAEVLLTLHQGTLLLIFHVTYFVSVLMVAGG